MVSENVINISISLPGQGKDREKGGDKMDLFDMLRQISTVTNCFFAIARAVEAQELIETFIEARDRAADLLSKEAQRQTINTMN